MITRATWFVAGAVAGAVGASYTDLSGSASNSEGRGILVTG